VPLSVLRRNFKPIVQAGEVTRIRQQTATRTTAWTLADLETDQ